MAPFSSIALPPLLRRCRYIFNLKCSEFSSDFLWQMRIITEPSKWVTVAMPLRELVLTRRGRIEVVQLPVPREVVNGVSMGRGGVGSARSWSIFGRRPPCPVSLLPATTHPFPRDFLRSIPFRFLPARPLVAMQFGVLLADGQNGPFKFEVQELRAVNHFDPASYANRSAQVLEANLKHQQRLAAAAESAEAEAKAGLGKPQRTSEELKEHYRKEREDAKLR